MDSIGGFRQSDLKGIAALRWRICSFELLGSFLQNLGCLNQELKDTGAFLLIIPGKKAGNSTPQRSIELLDLLDDLQLPRAIATSSRHEDARHHLGAHGLHDRFHAIVAHGDYVQGKPNPDPFLKAADRLGVDPALCLALEDSHNGVRAASRAGKGRSSISAVSEMTNSAVETA